MGGMAMKPRHPLQDRAKVLRNNATEVERRLWHHLRNRQMEGVKFRRQQPIEGYIVDFVSLEHRIVIELDGGQHADAQVEAGWRTMPGNDLRLASFAVIP